MKRIGDHSPWGYIDNVADIWDGIQFVTTPSHGGFWLSPKRLAELSAAALAASFHQQGRCGWFEEDCDWAIVVLAFPEAFDPLRVAAAAESLRHWKKLAPSQVRA